MSWTWRLESASGESLSVPGAPVQPTRSDAETWLGESWRELADNGITQASLYEDGVLIYGPMPLTE